MSFKRTLEIVVLTTISILMLILVFLVTASVVTRYIFNNPLTFSEELSRYAMIWLGLIGSSYVFVRNEHTAFTLVKEKICIKSKLVELIYDVGIQFLVIVFAGSAFVGGLFLVRDNFSQVSAILKWKMGYVYMVVPLSMLLIVIFQCINIVEIFKGRKKK